MKVFKFGGASVRDADGVRNLASIVRHTRTTTWSSWSARWGRRPTRWRRWSGTIATGRFRSQARRSGKWHQDVLDRTTASAAAKAGVIQRFDELDRLLERAPSGNVDRDYDQIVSQGEIWSTAIVSAHLTAVGIPHAWVDARAAIRTDDTWRDARIDWDASAGCANHLLERAPVAPRRIVTQGFIGGTAAGESTTIGREGSDFSAAIFAYLLDAEAVVIWKDVPGTFNAASRRSSRTRGCLSTSATRRPSS